MGWHFCQPYLCHEKNFRYIDDDFIVFLLQ